MYIIACHFEQIGIVDGYDVVVVAIQPNGRVKSGKDVIVRCTVDRDLSPSSPMTLTKREGSAVTQIGSDGYVATYMEANTRLEFEYIVYHVIHCFPCLL